MVGKSLKSVYAEIKKPSPVVMVVIAMTVLLFLVITMVVIPSRPVYTLFFGHSIKISSIKYSMLPQIATSGNNVYVVWQGSATGNGDIYFRASRNSGMTFGNTINLSHDIGTSSSPQIAADRNNVYVIWVNNTPANSEIYFKRVTWSLIF